MPTHLHAGRCWHRALVLSEMLWRSSSSRWKCRGLGDSVTRESNGKHVAFKTFKQGQHFSGPVFWRTYIDVTLLHRQTLPIPVAPAILGQASGFVNPIVHTWQAEDFSFMPDKPLCSLQNLVHLSELERKHSHLSSFSPVIITVITCYNWSYRQLFHLVKICEDGSYATW